MALPIKKKYSFDSFVQHLKSGFGWSIIIGIYSLVLLSCVEESIPPYNDNRDPEFVRLEFTPNDTIEANSLLRMTCYGEDPDGDSLLYYWSVPSGGLLDTAGQSVRYQADDDTGAFRVGVTIQDYWRASVTHYDSIYVIGGEAANSPPLIEVLEAERDTIGPSEEVTIYAQYTDEDHDEGELEVSWTKSGGIFQSRSSNQAVWVAPDELGDYEITLLVADPFETTSETIEINVATSGSFNNPPAIERVEASKPIIEVNDSTQVICSAYDPENDPLTFNWYSRQGRIIGGGSRIKWMAPEEVQMCTVYVEVSDLRNTTRGLTLIEVVPDTTVYYQTDFSSNDVLNQWTYEGLLSGLGDNNGLYTVNWDSTGQRMAVSSRTTYATMGFRLRQLSFLDGTFSATAEVPSTQYGMVAFLPKFFGESNYFLIGIDFFTQQWLILRCINGNLEYLAQDYAEFGTNVKHHFYFTQHDGDARAFINNVEVWQGEIGETFSAISTSIGVGVYGLEDSSPMFWDDFRVADP